jgi:acyl-CoA hydrolase
VEPVTLITRRLVKPEELNHHGSPYSGCTTEWFVEAGLIACSSPPNHNNSFLVRIHDMNFIAPATVGTVVNIESKIIETGKTRIVTHIRMKVKGNSIRGRVYHLHLYI